MRQIETPIAPQVFPDGLAVFYRTRNTAEAGDKPQSALEEYMRLPFEEKKVGDTRYYAALQADSKISRVIRVPAVPSVQPAGDVVMLAGDDCQYKVQKVSRNTLTYPESMDVTPICWPGRRA